MIRKLAIVLAAIALAAVIGGSQGAQGATTPARHFPIILIVGPRQALQLMNHHWTCTGTGRTATGAHRYACTPVQLIR